MSDENQLEDIKKRVDVLRTAKIRAQERLDNALLQLSENYGYQTVEEAQKAQDRLQKEIPLLESKLNKLLEHIEQKLDSVEQHIQ